MYACYAHNPRAADDLGLPERSRRRAL